MDLGLVALPLLDFVAVLVFGACWGLYAFATARWWQDRPSIAHVMRRHRRQWLVAFMARDNRIGDTNLVGHLMRSVTFFASTTILIVGGLIAVLGAGESAERTVAELPLTQSAGSAWVLKVVVLLLVFVYAFFKFTWAARQFNYLSVLMGGAPDAPVAPETAALLVERMSGLNSRAGDNFNAGLRAYYFALAVLAWFAHPAAFLAATALVLVVLWRREYHSHTLKLLDFELPDEPPQSAAGSGRDSR